MTEPPLLEVIRAHSRDLLRLAIVAAVLLGCEVLAKWWLQL